MHLRTNISSVYWWSNEVDDQKGRLGFEAARFTGALVDPWKAPDNRNDRSRAGAHTAWVDRLFDGAIALPGYRPHDGRAKAGANRPLTLLLVGPPGAGKSTFALELCFRAQLVDRDDVRRPECAYITTESDLNCLRHQASSFGWETNTREWLVSPREALNTTEPHTTVLEISESREFEDEPRVGWNMMEVSVDGDAAPQSRSYDRKELQEYLKTKSPAVVVIDSLNVLPIQDQQESFKWYWRTVSTSRAGLIVFVLDAPARSPQHEFWSYMCDTIVRLDRRYMSEYMVRTLEIEKARYQQHAWGVHQLKIYKSQKPAKDAAERKQQHPYRNEGGIFVFPSIHFYLSNYKRSIPSQTKDVKTPFEDLDKMLGGGFSAGRCVGLVGCRGGHKSHLGYRHVLEQLIKDQKQRALVVSLRDDEQVGLSTMEGILRNELGKSTEELNQLIRDDRLDMMYFPPGYITPDEFFHRVCLGIQRLKLQRRSDGSAPALTLLFNSLDQLGSRFPLCAREEIFVPGLIEMLNAEGVTSVFIGVQESGQPEQQYGLLSMADIIISADRVPGREYTVEKSDEELKKSRDDASAIANLLKESGDVVLLEVKRVAGGRAAGRAGVLHLDEQRGEKGGILRFASVRRRSAPV